MGSDHSKAIDATLTLLDAKISQIKKELENDNTYNGYNWRYWKIKFLLDYYGTEWGLHDIYDNYINNHKLSLFDLEAIEPEVKKRLMNKTARKQFERNIKEVTKESITSGVKPNKKKSEKQIYRGVY